MAQEYLLLNISLWIGFYLIVALSLNIEYGFGGIPNFGRALAVLMGAVAVGSITNRTLMAIFGVSGQIIESSGAVKSIANDLIAQNPLVGIAIFIFSLSIAAILGAATGALFILPSAKLSEDYLAITLLSISEVVYMTSYYHPDIIGGYYGISIPNVLAFIPGEQRLLVFSLITLSLAFITYLFVNRLLTSPYGRLLKAMRENEDVVKVYGKDVMKIRIKTVAIGSGVAAIAGALYSMYSVNVIATNFSRVEWTFYPFLMILLGGLGNNRGVVAGVAAFVTARIMLTTYKFEIAHALNLPFDPVWLEYILFGILMLLILVYRPEGIFKEKPIVTKPIKRVLERKKVAE
jgi:branched-chain amino acid transport system permease protein